MNERAERFSLTLGGPRDSRPRDARQWVIARCAALGVECEGPSLPLVVSELVTNACIHGGDPMSLHLEISGSRVRVEVEDSAADRPDVQSPTDRDPGGRGLLIVDSLSQVWGVEGTATGGKVVWAEVLVEKPGDETLQKIGQL